MNKLLTVIKAADILGYHPAYVRLLLRQGKIEGTKPTGKARSSWRITNEAVLKFLTAKGKKPREKQPKFEILKIEDYYALYRDGSKISIVADREEALKIAKHLGANMELL